MSIKCKLEEEFEYSIQFLIEKYFDRFHLMEIHIYQQDYKINTLYMSIQFSECNLASLHVAFGGFFLLFSPKWFLQVF